MLTGCHTCFQQHYLIILTQLHEAVDALGKLHHILNGLRYFDSAQLPHDFPGLGADRTEDRIVVYLFVYLFFKKTSSISGGRGESGYGYLALVALHLLLQEGLPGHLLQLLPQILTRLHVRLGDVLGQVLCRTTQGRREREPKGATAMAGLCMCWHLNGDAVFLPEKSLVDISFNRLQETHN